jgi:hypothetical protein
MNYLIYKKNYPKSCNLFFEWLATQDKIDYVDNAWFFYFFTNYFDWCHRWFMINKEKHIQELKKTYPKNYNQEKNELQFSVNSENDYDKIFNCLEILINKKLI